MEAFLSKIPSIIEMVALALSGVVVFATVAVRITPSEKDDKLVSKYGAKFYKVLEWLPTIGINPATKKYKEALEKFGDKKE